MASIAAVVAVLNFSHVKLLKASLYNHAKSMAYSALHAERDYYHSITVDPDNAASYVNQVDAVVEAIIIDAELSNELSHIDITFGTLEEEESGSIRFVAYSQPYPQSPTAAAVKISASTVFNVDVEERAIYALVATDIVATPCEKRYNACYAAAMQTGSALNNFLLNNLVVPPITLAQAAESYCAYGYMPSIDTSSWSAAACGRSLKFPYLGLLIDSPNSNFSERSIIFEMTAGAEASADEAAFYEPYKTNHAPVNVDVVAAQPSGAVAAGVGVSVSPGNIYSDMNSYDQSNLSEMSVGNIVKWSADLNNWTQLLLNPYEFANFISNYGIDPATPGASDDVYFSGQIYLGLKGICIQEPSCGLSTQASRTSRTCLATSMPQAKNAILDFLESLSEEEINELMFTEGNKEFLMSSCVALEASLNQDPEEQDVGTLIPSSSWSGW